MTTARIVGGSAILMSAIIDFFVLVSLEMFGGPANGYGDLHPALWIFLLAPLFGLVLTAAAIWKRASPRLILLVSAAPLLCQAVLFFAFVRTGALA